MLEAFLQLCFFKLEAAEHLQPFCAEPVRDPTRYFKMAVTVERAKHGLVGDLYYLFCVASVCLFVFVFALFLFSQSHFLFVCWLFVCSFVCFSVCLSVFVRSLLSFVLDLLP